MTDTSDAVVDVRDLHPRGPDRRKAPRRAEDAAVHYTALAALASAIAWTEDELHRHRHDVTSARLRQAINDYRTAVARQGQR
jgi:hypothetical protein